MEITEAILAIPSVPFHNPYRPRIVLLTEPLTVCDLLRFHRVSRALNRSHAPSAADTV